MARFSDFTPEGDELVLRDALYENEEIGWVRLSSKLGKVYRMENVTFRRCVSDYPMMLSQGEAFGLRIEDSKFDGIDMEPEFRYRNLVIQGGKKIKGYLIRGTLELRDENDFAVDLTECSGEVEISGVPFEHVRMSRHFFGANRETFLGFPEAREVGIFEFIAEDVERWEFVVNQVPERKEESEVFRELVARDLVYYPFDLPT